MTSPRHTDAILQAFPVENGELLIDGIPLTRLARQVGQTPFYAYDRCRIADRVAHLRHHLPTEIHLHYAIKANPMPAVVQHLAGLVDGFDLASAGEMRLALDTGMSPAHISFAGPGKSEAEIAAAIAAGITLNLESETELATAARLGQELGLAPRVAVRVNPAFELRSAGMKMGGRPSPFGIDEERVPAVLGRIGKLGLDFQGLHIFCGSQNLRPEAIIEAQERTFELAARLAGDAPAPIRSLNIGGGFGIPYFPGERPLDIAPIGECLDRLLESKERHMPEARVILELGRYLVGEAGVYVCRVVDRKPSRGRVFLVTDGGLHHHLAASGNFGQVIRKNYPVLIGTRMDSPEREEVSIVGPLCTPLDLLADRMELPRAEVGDLVVVLQSGAYGRSASPRDFLGHPPAGEVLV
ncbi:MAG TPA: pyridoxal-dependent decarboxylase, exosortase A system-associated [Gammaproteobacteria bacterium]|nr:pyridoxal-dependent decarboxylase, exosortase A system-associated [Gammaproteobacteria bacterium]